MNRPLQVLDSTGLVTFDGRLAVTFVLNLETSIPASRIRFKYLSPGQLYTFIIRQDDTGGHKITWPDAVRDASAVNPEPGATTVMNFIGNTGGYLYSDLPGTN